MLLLSYLSRTAGYLVIVLALCCLARAQQLSIRHYDVQDGLAHSRVVAIHQDAKGYLWFGTWEGLSRFDGYRFANYTANDGLGIPLINAITEDRKGRLWAATNGAGIARLRDEWRETPAPQSGEPAKQKFESFRVGDSQQQTKVETLQTANAAMGARLRAVETVLRKKTGVARRHR